MKHNTLPSYNYTRIRKCKTRVQPKTFHIFCKAIVVDDTINQLSMPRTLVNKDVPRTCQGLIGRKITIILSLGMRTFAHHAFYLIIIIIIMTKTTIIYNINIILGLYVERRHSTDPSDTATSSWNRAEIFINKPTYIVTNSWKIYNI